ncbi:MAG: DUF4062 domain-containing protein [Myxococcales bacterium]|nr:DUF4062 domain-containing protein [Myxococcales bacterium]
MAEFCRLAGPKGLRVGNKARVFKVLKTPVDRAAEPKPLDELLGYEFFEVDKASGRTREFSLSEDVDRKFRTSYYQRLDDLAQDVAELLQQIEHEPQQVGGPAEPAAIATATKVYLASTSFDRHAERDSVRRELQGSGIELVPGQSPPLYSPACEEFIREQLAGAALSVHIIGEKYGIVPEGTDSSLIALEAEQALVRADVHSLFWLAPGTAAEDERQAKLIARLQSAGVARTQQELLVCPIEQFKLHINKRLDALARAAEKAAAPEEGEDEDEDDAKLIYLVCDQRDLDAIESVYDYLFERGFEVRLPAFEGDEAQVRHDHEEALVECDAVLVYWGAGNDLWLRRKMRDLKKVMGLGRSAPFSAKGIYVMMSESPTKSHFRTREAQVYQQAGDFDPAVLEGFASVAMREG